MWGERLPEAYYFRSHETQVDPVCVKALVLQLRDRKIALISVDLVAVFPALRKRVAQEIAALGIRESDLFMAATHTHSGPGGFVQFKFWEVLATDKFNPPFFASLADRITQAVREADQRLRPALWGVSQSRMPGFTQNRRFSPVDEPVLTYARVETADTSEPIAHLINFPVHGTFLKTDSNRMSADFPGAVERAVERRFGGTALFLSDAAGDIDPLAQNYEVGTMESLAESFALEAESQVRNLVTKRLTKMQTADVMQPLGTAQVNVQKCLSILGAAGQAIGRLIHKSIDLPKEFDQPLRLRGLQLDQHFFYFVPGEPITVIGSEAKALAKTAGFKSASVVGLADGYLGYILTPSEYARGGYESCNSFYGSQFGLKFLLASSRLIDQFRMNGDR